MTTSGQSESEAEIANQLRALASKLACELHPSVNQSKLFSLKSKLDKDLGLDSLARVELMHRVEQFFQVSLPADSFVTIETLEDVLRVILSSRLGQAPFDQTILQSIDVGVVNESPEDATTLIEVLEWHMNRHPDRQHIEIYQDAGRGVQLSFAQIAANSYRTGWGLIELGISRGTTVSLMLPTGPEYFYSFLGVLSAGAIPVPIYPPTRLSQIESYIRRHQTILKNCHTQVMITTKEIKKYSTILKALVPSLTHVVCFEDFFNKSHKPLGISISPSDIAFIQYTSGSTAEPKGVQLTHANLLANIRAMSRVTELTSKDIFVSWLPLYHDMGLIGAWLGMFYNAARLVVMSPLEFLARPKRWLWAIHRYRATISAAPNFAYDLCMHRLDDKDLDGLDLSCWRIACNGAEPIVPETIREFCRKLSPYGFNKSAYWPVYGLAESSVGLAFPPKDNTPLIARVDRDEFSRSGEAVFVDDNHPNALEFVACGRVLPGHDFRIVDDLDIELPDNTQGHLQFKGPSATKGYFEKPDKTAELYHKDWLDSGDLAFIHQGQVYLTGRSKDIIIRGGRNIYPHEIEEAVSDIHGIRRGRVVAFGYRETQDKQEKLIVLAESREKDPTQQEVLRDEIQATCQDIVSVPPDEVVIAPPNTILKTSSGKLRRGACKELYLKGKVGTQAVPLWWQLSKVALSGLTSQALKLFRHSSTIFFSAYAWLVSLTTTFLCLPLILIVPNKDSRFRFASAICRFLLRATAIKVKTSGDFNFKKVSPCILVANHASYVDVFLLLAVLPERIVFVAKSEFRSNFFSGPILKRMGVAFVERFDRQQSIKDAAALETIAESIFIFPEGTFTRQTGLATFHMGAFLTAVKTKRPVIPISIVGSRGILRGNSFFLRKGQVTVHAGPAIVSEELDSEWQSALDLKDRARAEILQQCMEPDLDNN